MCKILKTCLKKSNTCLQLSCHLSISVMHVDNIVTVQYSNVCNIVTHSNVCNTVTCETVFSTYSQFGISLRAFIQLLHSSKVLVCVFIVRR